MKWPAYLSVVLLIFFSSHSAVADDSSGIEEKILQSGLIVFQPKLGQKIFDERALGYTLDEQGRVTCNADVRYPEVSDTIKKNQFRYRNYVNQRFKMLAEASRCTEDLSNASLQPTVTFFRGSIISVMFYVGELGQGGNGGCHGHQEYMTFDLNTGKEFALSDFLYAKDFPEIRSSIIDFFDKQDIKSTEIATILDEKFWSLGFYIENGKIFVDMNAFLKSCAEGDHFPVEIPSKFLRHNYENQSVFAALNSKL